MTIGQQSGAGLNRRTTDGTLKVLFIGRKSCDFSDRCVKLLEQIGCELTVLLSDNREDDLSSQVTEWHGHYLFSFRNLYIVPRALLDRVSIAAVNFHPGPPEYPGSGCLNFALYDLATSFGVTAHYMVETVDQGTIIDCRRFPVTADDNVDSLLARTHKALFELFVDFICEVLPKGLTALDEMASKHSDERWSGNRRKISAIEALRHVTADVSPAELSRIIRAAHTEKFPVVLQLHGERFALISDSTKIYQ